MSRSTDFSDDLAVVSEAVNTDVAAIMKIVRQKDERGGTSVVEQLQPNEPVGFLVNEQATSLSSHLPSQTAKHKSVISRARHQLPLTEPEILENVTTRLRRETNELLTEVALRQKLKKEVPATRQDIIEAALQEWFQRQGYSRKVEPRE
jgi:hypothetical protein